MPKIEITLDQNQFNVDSGDAELQVNAVENLFRVWVNAQDPSGAVKLEELTDKLDEGGNVMKAAVDRNTPQGEPGEPGQSRRVKSK